MARMFLWLLAPFILVVCTEYKLGSAEDAGDYEDSGAAPDLDGGIDADDDAGELTFDGQITGRVCDPAGADGGGWVAGAYVYTSYDSDFDGVDDTTSEDTTDSDGRFLLEGLPTGREYIVSVVKGSFEASFTVMLTTGTYELPEDECMLEAPNIAVVMGEYDRIEDIIANMGLDYTTYNGRWGETEYLDFLKDPAAMAEYDIIFFNCGITETWTDSDIDREVIRENIRSFVNAGGSIYVSDWAYLFVELPFPEKIAFYGEEDSMPGAPRLGRSDTVEGAVIDLTMQAIVGSGVADINFEVDMWVVVESISDGVSPLIEATVEVSDLLGSFNTLTDVPIAARFEMGTAGGRAIFTSFHNENEATTLDMTDILEEIILSL